MLLFVIFDFDKAGNSYSTITSGLGAVLICILQRYLSLINCRYWAA